jgi:hypothetical protein
MKDKLLISFGIMKDENRVTGQQDGCCPFHKEENRNASFERPSFCIDEK